MRHARASPSSFTQAQLTPQPELFFGESIMRHIVRSQDRGLAEHGWLTSRHTFSFAGYHNPSMMGFSKLRVVNEDVVAPGRGFDTHPHRDMEILSYVIDGKLEHKDSMGNGSTIAPGDLQRMTAGSGVLHSEFNGSDDDAVHFLQIWILPEVNGLEPGYEQRHFGRDEKLNRLRLVASRDGREDSVIVHQDVDLYAAVAEAGTALTHRFARRRSGFLQLVSGSLQVDDEELLAGDALMMQDPVDVEILASADTELLLFDMASG